MRLPANPTLALDAKYLSNARMLWELFIVKHISQQTTLTLAYSWILPPLEEQDGWKAAEEIFKENFEKDGKVHKVELIKARYYGTPLVIQHTLNGLLIGKNLMEALEAAGASAAPTAIVNLELVAADYVVRPEIFLAPDTRTGWTNRPLPSPAEGCFLVQLFHLKKEKHVLYHLLQDGESRFLAMRLLKSLTLHTSFLFDKGSAPRIGNVEWYRFEYYDWELHPEISIGVTQMEDGSSVCRVEFAANAAREERKIRVRCRFCNDKEVVIDRMKDALLGREEKMIEFSVPCPVSYDLVTVWHEVSPDEWALVFERDGVRLRSIQFNVMMVSGTYKTKGLSLLKRVDKRNASQAKELETFNRAAPDRGTVISNLGHDPYVTSGREIITSMEKMFPAPSKGKFFLNGWDHEAEEHGQLSFVKWMLDVISSTKDARLVLLDPYFDDGGIDLFAHARHTGFSFTILTCTQHRDEDGVALSDAGSGTTNMKHEDRLILACRAYEALLNNLQFELLDLQSKDGGKKALFHDRYLLLSGKDGIPKAGFHLSNSIQGATKNAPLLVTPIPDDILGEVAKYIEELSNADHASPAARKTEVKTLYSNISESVSHPKESVALIDTPGLGGLMALITGDPALSDLLGAPLELELINRGLLRPERNNTSAPEPLTSVQVVAMVSELNALGQEDFNKTFGAFCIWIAHYQDETFSEILLWLKERAHADVRFKNQLFGVFTSFQQYSPILPTRIMLCKALQGDSFENTAIHAARVLQHHGPLYGEQYIHQTTAELLLHSCPGEAVQYVESICEQIQAAHWNEGDAKVRAIMVQLNVFFHYTIGHPGSRDLSLQMLLLQSRCQSLRAASAAAIWVGATFRESPEPGIPHLPNVLACLRDHLSPAEYRLSLAVAISWLRVDMYEVLISDWAEDTGVLMRVLGVLYGNLPYSPAITITDKCLLPLERTGFVEVGFTRTHWNAIFIGLLKTSSEQIKDNNKLELSALAHGYLYKALLDLLIREEGGEQVKTIQEWISAVKGFVYIFSQPFAEMANHATYGSSCKKVYWLVLGLKYLSHVGVAAETQEFIDGFLIRWDTYFQSASRRLQPTEGKQSVLTISAILAVS